jgi:acetyl esterase/lipase
MERTGLMRFWLYTLVAVFAVTLATGMLTYVACSDPSPYIADQYRIVPNIPYVTVNNWHGTLDLYLPPGVAGPHPTVIYIHGGGWIGQSKETNVLHLLPYLEMRWAVVNVEYRLGQVAPGPASVEDCRCALRWVIRNAMTYNLDTSQLVVTGHSAGGHLALTTGMLPASAGFDDQCQGAEDLRVAAIINWFGITDVGDLLDGANKKDYAIAWLSNQINRDEIAKRVSPLSYVRPGGLPPIFTVHGTDDSWVPYAHAVRLHKALDKAGMPHQLLTISGGGHGGFGHAETVKIYSSIRDFLAKHHIMRRSPGAISKGRECLSRATLHVTRWMPWLGKALVRNIYDEMKQPGILAEYFATAAREQLTHQKTA